MTDEISLWTDRHPAPKLLDAATCYRQDDDTEAEAIARMMYYNMRSDSIELVLKYIIANVRDEPVSEHTPEMNDLIMRAWTGIKHIAKIDETE